MKLISQNIGRIIASLAAIAVCCGVITGFKAPIGKFFLNIVNGETAIGDNVTNLNVDLDLNGPEVSYTYKWVKTTWNGTDNKLYARYIWNDNNNIYYSVGGAGDGNGGHLYQQYALAGDTWGNKDWQVKEGHEWTSTNQDGMYFYNGIAVFSGNYIWKVGNTVYYSYNNEQFVLNNGIWEEKDWVGLTSFNGDNIWSDGSNTYFSLSAKQYKLNGDTWEPITWNISNISAGGIWTDGKNTYYSWENNQYKLNGDTWEAVTWNGYTPEYGSYIWSEDDNIYYSYQLNQYKLNGDTWEKMTWKGLVKFDGCNVWTDGKDFYYSYGDGKQYVLEKEIVLPPSPPSKDEIITEKVLGTWTDGTNYLILDDGMGRFHDGPMILKEKLIFSWKVVDGNIEFKVTTSRNETLKALFTDNKGIIAKDLSKIVIGDLTFKPA